MRLFVDYTNWKGRRAWREIKREFNNSWPPEWDFLAIIQPGKAPVGVFDTEITFVIHVAMVDKGGARRTLRLDRIHGFSTDPAVLLESQS
jgi:hypothetical protein